MKKLFLIIVILSASLFSFAQWSGTNPLTTSSNVNILSPGNDASLDVGGSGDSATVQITTPWVVLSSYVGPLRIRGTNFIYPSTTHYFPLLCVAPNGFVGLRTETPSEMLHLNGGNILTNNGNITVNNGDITVREGSIRISNSGGTNNFRVDEDGFLIARQVDVHLDPIPDYVFHTAFDKDSLTYYQSTGIYKPMTLQDLDTFVQTNRHLPGIKSASEYQKAGSINVGELQLKLLQKIEELTLYNIHLMKQIEELKLKQTVLENTLNNQ